MMVTSEKDGDFEILWVAAKDWPCNRGKSVRRFPGGMIGEEAEFYEYEQTDE